MMKRQINRKILFMCVCLILGVIISPTVTHAQDVNFYAQPRMAYIQSYKVELTISSSGKASITGVVTGKFNATSTFVEATLQKYVSGAWVDVETWEDSNNGIRSSVNETYSVSRGTYRVVMTCGANSETKTVTSEL